MAHRAKTADKGGTHHSPSTADGVGDADALRREIELRAYHLYCERGCAPGNDLDDWIAAEQNVLSTHRSPPSTVGE